MKSIRYVFGCVCLFFPFWLLADNYSWEQLQQIRNGYESRREEAFSLLKGKKLIREKVIPPIFPDGSDFSRHYSYSLIDYAFKCFWLNEDIKGANAALLENANYYIGYPRAYKDKDSFYWAADELCKIVEFFGSNGVKKKGLIQKDVEERIFLMMWQYSTMQSRVSKAEYSENNTWHIDESENHHVQRFYAAWHFAKFLMSHPDYASKKYNDGHTAKEHFDAWNKYIKVWTRERGRKGLFIEMANDSYGLETLKGVYNFYDFGDNELKSLSKQLLDLYWAAWSQEQMNSVRAGAKSRVYPYEAAKGRTPFRKMAWYYLGTNEINYPYNNLFTLITSDYRMPLLVMDIALNTKERGVYEIKQRRLGRAEKGFFTPPDYHVLENDGLLRYTYCTPQFMAGSFMCEARPYEDWVLISSQNRWAGIVFAGDADTRIYAHCKTGKDNRAYNQFWTVQEKGAMIFHKLDSVFHSRGTKDMRMWISKAGLGNWVERKGWIFVESGGAYVALRCVGDGYTIQEEKGGYWVVGNNSYSPFVVEVSLKDKFISYADFQRRIESRKCTIEGNKVIYNSLTDDVLTIPLDYKGLPTVNGCEIDVTPTWGMNSPFVKSVFGSGIVTVEKDGKSLVLNFNE